MRNWLLTISAEVSEDDVVQMFNASPMGRLLHQGISVDEMDEYQLYYRHDFLLMMYKCQSEYEHQEYEVLTYYSSVSVKPTGNRV